MKDYRISLLADYYAELLSPRALEIVRYCYDDDMSLAEAAELLGISRQAVGETLTKAVATLTEYEEKLKLVSTHEAAQKELDLGTAALESGDTKTLFAALERLRELI